VDNSTERFSQANDNLCGHKNAPLPVCANISAGARLHNHNTGKNDEFLKATALIAWCLKLLAARSVLRGSIESLVRDNNPSTYLVRSERTAY
jgi:hypothetical protein